MCSCNIVSFLLISQASICAGQTIQWDIRGIRDKNTDVTVPADEEGTIMAKAAICLLFNFCLALFPLGFACMCLRMTHQREASGDILRCSNCCCTVPSLHH